MKIRVDWYKASSGKWKYGGIVDVGDARLWRGDIPQAIVDNQTILMDGWQDHESYIVVTRDLPETEHDPNYKEFTFALFFPHEFKGLKRKQKEETNE